MAECPVPSGGPTIRRGGCVGGSPASASFDPWPSGESFAHPAASSRLCCLSTHPKQWGQKIIEWNLRNEPSDFISRLPGVFCDGDGDRRTSSGLEAIMVVGGRW